MSHTVIILGAGATFGAAFRSRGPQDETWNRRHAGAPPPAMDADFFERLQQISDGNQQHDSLIQAVTADARWVAVGGRFPSLEAMFSYIEASRRKNIGPAKINGRSPDAVKSDLLRAIALQLGSALCKPNVEAGNDAHYQCEHHNWLAKARVYGGPGLDASDTIIGFNYDCLMDFALARNSHSWNARTGYGIEAHSGWEQWTPGEGSKAPAKSLKLLKMHGSLNWEKGADEFLTLIGHNYTEASAPHLVPPDWRKEQLEGWPFKDVWAQASDALATARSVVAIGYSMPATDLPIQIVIRAARDRSTQPLERVIVVNPDDGAHQRTLQVIAQGKDRKARIVRARDWEEFRGFDPSLWNI